MHFYNIRTGGSLFLPTTLSLSWQSPSHLFGSAGREQVVYSLSLARGVVQGLARERKPIEAQSLHQGRSGRDLQWSVCDSAASIRRQVAHHPRRILIWQDFTSK